MAADFGGYVTAYNRKCTDGRTIMHTAFEQQNGQRVPLVWDHQRHDPENILGYVELEHRAFGTYGLSYLNGTPKAKHTKMMLEHGDIDSMSIYATNLVERSSMVHQGIIREVSLVLAGANDGAKIDYVNLEHSDGFTEPSDDIAVIYSGEKIELEHAAGDDGDDDDETIDLQEVVESMNEEQRGALDYLVSQALKNGPSAEHSDEGDEDEDDEEDDDSDESEEPDEENDGTDGTDDEKLNHSQEGTQMTVTAFEQFGATGGTGTVTAQKHLTHSQIKGIIGKAEELGSFREAMHDFVQHADGYGIDDIELLFPDAKAVSNTPEFIKRRTEWVNSVLSGTHHSPFSRVKTLFADITHEEARALGYIKGNFKKTEWIKLQARVTTPKTIYKKQKLDRDDVHDITDLDVVAWLKAEMRLMLEEEIARAILISDGRPEEDPANPGEPNPDKIDTEHIRPIAYDSEFFAPKVIVSVNTVGDALVEQILRNKKTLRGSGSPSFYTTTDVVTDMLMAKDRLGQRIYKTKADLAATLGVASIVEVEVMEDQDPELLGILVNLRDYTIGADKGGKTAFFEDFDIDYNQMKYLYETRFSGALTRWRSALVFRRATGGTEVVPTEPTFNSTTGVVTIPTVEGVTYRNAFTGDDLAAGAQAALDPGDSLYVEAVADEDYYFAPGTDADWEFTRPSE